MICAETVYNENEDTYMYFVLQLHLKMSWTDPRLQYQNLNKMTNEIPFDEYEKIWMPSFLFANTKEKEIFSFKNASTVALIKINPKSQPKQNPMDHLYNGLYYNGNDW